MKKTMIILVAALTMWGCGSNHKGAIEASGTLEATEVKVGAKVPGQIEKLYVEEGTQVKEGDTLVVLDRKTLTLQWKQAQAGAEAVDAQYRLLVKGARSEDVRVVEEGLRQAEAAFKIASDDYARMKDLLASNTVTQKQFDDAQSRHTIAQAQLASARQNLQKVQQFARPEELAAAKARLDQAKAAADLFHQQLTDATILAPVSGTITEKPVEEGELIGVGAVVVTIARLEQLNLMIYVNENELGKVKLGGKADVVIDTYPDRTFPGKVIFISPIAEFTPKNVQTKEDRTSLVFGVKLQVDNTEGILKSGMPADAYVQ
jgi:HlyD family secretion protein